MESNNNEIFARNLANHINKKRKNRKQISDELGVSYSTLTDWVNGKKFPRIDKINMLANYFGVSKSELIDDLEEIQKDDDRVNAIVNKLRTNKELLDVVERLTCMF